MSLDWYRELQTAKCASAFTFLKSPFANWPEPTENPSGTRIPSRQAGREEVQFWECLKGENKQNE